MKCTTRDEKGWSGYKMEVVIKKVNRKKKVIIKKEMK
jgi:hypothetical protein